MTGVRQDDVKRISVLLQEEAGYLTELDKLKAGGSKKPGVKRLIRRLTSKSMRTRNELNELRAELHAA